MARDAGRYASNILQNVISQLAPVPSILISRNESPNASRRSDVSDASQGDVMNASRESDVDASFHLEPANDSITEQDRGKELHVQFSEAPFSQDSIEVGRNTDAYLSEVAQTSQHNSSQDIDHPNTGHVGYSQASFGILNDHVAFSQDSIGLSNVSHVSLKDCDFSQDSFDVSLPVEAYADYYAHMQELERQEQLGEELANIGTVEKSGDKQFSRDSLDHVDSHCEESDIMSVNESAGIIDVQKEITIPDTSQHKMPVFRDPEQNPDEREYVREGHVEEANLPNAKMVSNAPEIRVVNDGSRTPNAEIKDELKGETTEEVASAPDSSRGDTHIQVKTFDSFQLFSSHAGEVEGASQAQPTLNDSNDTTETTHNSSSDKLSSDIPVIRIGDVSSRDTSMEEDVPSLNEASFQDQTSSMHLVDLDNISVFHSQTQIGEIVRMEDDVLGSSTEMGHVTEGIDLQTLKAADSVSVREVDEGFEAGSSHSSKQSTLNIQTVRYIYADIPTIKVEDVDEMTTLENPDDIRDQEFGEDETTLDSLTYEQDSMDVSEKSDASAITEKLDASAITEKSDASAITEKSGASAITEKSGASAVTLPLDVSVYLIQQPVDTRVNAVKDVKLDTAKHDNQYDGAADNKYGDGKAESVSHDCQSGRTNTATRSQELPEEKTPTSGPAIPHHYDNKSAVNQSQGAENNESKNNDSSINNQPNASFEDRVIQQIHAVGEIYRHLEAVDEQSEDDKSVGDENIGVRTEPADQASIQDKNVSYGTGKASDEHDDQPMSSLALEKQKDVENQKQYEYTPTEVSGKAFHGQCPEIKIEFVDSSDDNATPNLSQILEEAHTVVSGIVEQSAAQYLSQMDDNKRFENDPLNSNQSEGAINCDVSADLHDATTDSHDVTTYSHDVTSEVSAIIDVHEMSVFHSQTDVTGLIWQQELDDSSVFEGERKLSQADSETQSYVQSAQNVQQCLTVDTNGEEGTEESPRFRKRVLSGPLPEMESYIEPEHLDEISTIQYEEAVKKTYGKVPDDVHLDYSSSNTSQNKSKSSESEVTSTGSGSELMAREKLESTVLSPKFSGDVSEVNTEGNTIAEEDDVFEGGTERDKRSVQEQDGETTIIAEEEVKDADIFKTQCVSEQVQPTADKLKTHDIKGVEPTIEEHALGIPKPNDASEKPTVHGLLSNISSLLERTYPDENSLNSWKNESEEDPDDSVKEEDSPKPFTPRSEAVCEEKADDSDSEASSSSTLNRVYQEYFRNQHGHYPPSDTPDSSECSDDILLEKIIRSAEASQETPAHLQQDIHASSTDDLSRIHGVHGTLSQDTYEEALSQNELQQGDTLLQSILHSGDIFREKPEAHEKCVLQNAEVPDSVSSNGDVLEQESCKHSAAFENQELQRDVYITGKGVKSEDTAVVNIEEQHQITHDATVRLETHVDKRTEGIAQIEVNQLVEDVSEKEGINQIEDNQIAEDVSYSDDFEDSSSENNQENIPEPQRHVAKESGDSGRASQTIHVSDRQGSTGDSSDHVTSSQQVESKARLSSGSEHYELDLAIPQRFEILGIDAEHYLAMKQKLTDAAPHATSRDIPAADTSPEENNIAKSDVIIEGRKTDNPETALVHKKDDGDGKSAESMSESKRESGVERSRPEGGEQSRESTAMAAGGRDGNSVEEDISRSDTQGANSSFPGEITEEHELMLATGAQKVLTEILQHAMQSPAASPNQSFRMEVHDRKVTCKLKVVSNTSGDGSFSAAPADVSLVSTDAMDASGIFGNDSRMSGNTSDNVGTKYEMTLCFTATPSGVSGNPALDSIYLRNEPHGGATEDDATIRDETSVGIDTNASIPFDATIADASIPFPNDEQRGSLLEGVRLGFESGSGSDVDTEEEVEAVRREMRAAFLRIDQQQEQRPADLEGSRFPAEVAVRQSAEGVVEAPVHTDGDGQDDNDTLTGGQGSNTTPPPPPSSERQAGAGSTQREAGAGSTQRQAGAGSTLDVLQGLGFAGAQPQRTRTGNRNAPTGDSGMNVDVTSSTDARRVHFASVNETRERTLSGASDEEQPTAQNSTLRDQTGAEELDSMFFKPTQALAASQMSEASMGGPGLEHSTFNLGDLCQSGMRQSHLDDTHPHDSHVRHSQERDAFPRDSFPDDSLPRDSFPPNSHERDSYMGEASFDSRQFESPPAESRQEVVGSEDGFDDKPMMTKQDDDARHDEVFVGKLKEKQYVAEDSPVYIDETGEGVTDLAYHVPLNQVGTNPFDDESFGGGGAGFSGGGGGFSMGQSGFEGQEMLQFDTSQFKSGDEGKALLDADEKENAENQQFLQEEQMEASHLLHTGSSLGLPDSWSLHSHIQMSDRPSWLTDEEVAYTRISVGTFMGSRTEALGSLDGDRGDTRPTFGSRIKTPPSDRRPPQPLYQKTPPPRLQHIAEAKSSEEGVRAEAGTAEEGVRADTGTADDGVRRAGVGSDSEADALRDQAAQASSQANTRTAAGAHASEDENEDDRPLTPEDLISDTAPGNQISNQPISKTTGQPTLTSIMADKPGELNLSDITNLITAASSDANSQELTEMLYKMSLSKKGGDAPVNKTEAKPTREQARPTRLPSPRRASLERKPSDVSAVPEKPLEPRSAYTRIPADGKSDRKSLTAPAPKKSSSSKPSTSSTGRKSGSTYKARGSGSGESGVVRSSLTSSTSGTRVSPRGGAGAVDTGSRAKSTSSTSARGRSAERAKQSNLQGPSKIPTLRRQGSNDSMGRKSGSGERKTRSPERAPRGHSGSRETLSRATQRPKSKERTTKQSAARTSSVHDSNKRLSNKSSKVRSSDDYDDDTSVFTQGPTTPKHLVLREKNNTSFGSPGLSRGIAGDDSEASPEWRSPRPSSFLTRSQREERETERQHALDMSSFYTSDQERPAAPEGENLDQDPYPVSYSNHQAKSVMFSANSDRNSSLNVKHTPDGKSSPRSRLSSTPKDGAPAEVTLNSQYSISHIGYTSPKDKRASTNYDNDSTLTSEQTYPGGLTQSHSRYGDYMVEQSTPKAPRYNTRDVSPHSPAAPRYQKHIDSLGTEPRSDRHPIKSLQQDKPVLLTNQRLTETAFASRYLDGEKGRTRDAWKSATAPALPNGNMNNNFDRLSTGSHQNMTSYATEDISVRVTSELRFEETCCVGLSVHSTLTLHNPTSKWVHVVLKLVALSIDGASVDVTSVMPFVMKEKVIVEQSSKEEVKVIFAPRQAGVYVAQLHVVASPVVSDLPLQADRLPAVVTLQAMAEKPNVQLVTPSQSRLLDFGAIPWNSHKGMPLCLINHSRANVPVRLIISSNKSSPLWSPYSNCFTFERYTTGDVSSISNKSRPSIPSLSPTVVNYSLAPCGPAREVSPSQVMVYFVAPPRHQDRGSSGPPEDFTAKIDLEVDSPCSLMKLGSVILRASAGTARLHTPRDLACVQLSAEVGRVHTQVVPLLNAGNIPIDVTLEVSHYPELFSAVPSQLQVEPGGLSKVTVTFAPKESGTEKLHSLLLMSIEPDGPSYEVPLEGAVVSHHKPQHIHSKAVRGPQLLSNKSLLVWGGVPLGRARQQSLTLKNVCEQMLKLRLEIKASHDNFQLQTLFGEKEKLSSSKEILLKPLETFPIHVLFAPTKIRGIDAKLQMRVVNSTVKYTIPLCGYGGISKLIIEDAQKGQSNNYWTTLGSPRSHVTSLVKVTVRNIGSRAAYVKFLGFSDLACKRPIPSARLTLQPEELCIQANSSREVKVILQPTESDVEHCAEKPSIIGAIALLYGDEVTRQQLRRSIQKYGKACVKTPDNSLVKDTAFHVPFEEEENVSQGEEGIKDTPKDVDIFYATMSKMMLALVGEPAPIQPTIQPTTSNLKPTISTTTVVDPTDFHSKPNTALLTHNGNMGSALNEKAQYISAFDQRSVTPTDKVNYLSGENKPEYSPPVRDTVGSSKVLSRVGDENKANLYRTVGSTLGNTGHSGGTGSMKSGTGLYATVPTTSLSVDLNSMTVHRSDSGGEWSVQPESLVLPAPVSDHSSCVKRLQLVNYSARTLKFDLSWPAHIIHVTPEHGTVAPRQTAILCVTARANLRSRHLQLPWAGRLILTCDGREQVVNIQIREGAQSEDSLLLTTDTPHNQHQPLATVSATPMTTTNSLVSVATPVHPCVQSVVHSKTPTQQLTFTPTQLDKISDAYMEVTNTSAFPVKWQLSSFTPPYFKCAQGKDEVLRVTYSVYWLPTHAGLLHAGQREKIQVCFQPREVGSYSQHWELRTEAQGVPISATQRTKYEFLAEAVAGRSNPPGIVWSEVIAENGLTTTTTFNTNRTRDEPGKAVSVKAASERLVFPVTCRAASHVCKLHLKNTTKDPHTVTIQRPEAPFTVRHSSVTLKPRHYIKVPVEFSPKKEGHYQAMIVLKVDTGETLMVTLIGQCK